MPLTEQTKAEILRLALQPGVRWVDLFENEIELVGSLEDSDDLAGTVRGRFEVHELRDAFPFLHVIDCRS